jgi:hypothetical protein
MKANLKTWGSAAPLRAVLLDALKVICPPAAVIHVGAGAGQGDLHRWRTWGVPMAWLIDADEERLRWTQDEIARHPGWQALSAVLASTECAATFHHTTNPDEDGLQPPAQLGHLWPNLKETGHTLCTTGTLDALLGTGLGVPEHAWLVIDCLGAPDIIAGGQAVLAHIDMICARVERPCAMNDEYPEKDAIALDGQLETQGFLRIGFIESNHPALGHVFYVRDRSGQVDQLREQVAVLGAAAEQAAASLQGTRNDRDDLARRHALSLHQHEALEQVNLVLTQERDVLVRVQASLEQEKSALARRQEELERQVADLTQTRDAETKAKADAQTRIGVLEKEKGELSAARDQQAKLAQERQGQIEQLTQARDAETKGKADAQARIGVLEKEKGELSAARDQQAKLAQERQGQIEQLTQARDAEAKGKAETIAQKEALAKEKTDAIAERDESRQRLQDQQARMQQLETENTEARMRQTLLQDELVKAEAQIELIKDLLLREPGL